VATRKVTLTTRRAAARIRDLANAKGLSMNRLADFSGLSRGYVSRLLRAEQWPTLDTLAKLAEALGADCPTS
jgi:transcriptional regulator with XRE-family HTH domain